MHDISIYFCQIFRILYIIVYCVGCSVWPEMTKEPQTANRETKIILRYRIYRKLSFAVMQCNVILVLQ